LPVAAAPSSCPSATEYLNGNFSAARSAFADHYGKKFYVNGPGCMDADYQLTPSDPSDLSSCVVASGGHLKRFIVNGTDEPDRIAYVGYVFEGGSVSEADISLLLGGAPLEATTEAPFPLQGMFARDPDGRLYKSLDGRLLVRLASEPNPRPSWDKQQPVHVVTVYNFAVIAHPTEGMMRCYRAYGVIK
jgi:hypothetical protein